MSGEEWVAGLMHAARVGRVDCPVCGARGLEGCREPKDDKAGRAGGDVVSTCFACEGSGLRDWLHRPNGPPCSVCKGIGKVVRCTGCSGEGYVAGAEKCDICMGRGVVPSREDAA